MRGSPAPKKRATCGSIAVPSDVLDGWWCVVSRSSSIRVRDEGAGRYFERGTALNRFLLEAPYLARCSDDKTAAKVRPREYAIRFPYMQVNRPGMVSWLIFDLDHSNSVIWDDANLPPPNMVVRNRETGTSHLYYAIHPVCTTEKGRSKPIEYMRAIYEAMTIRLNADPQFHSGPVAKTPGHPWWSTWELHAQVYDLAKLAEYVDLPVRSKWGRAPNLESVSHSRHCTLFEVLRFYAYSVVGREREHGTFESFTRVLEAFAHNSNSFRKLGFAADLPLPSIAATVKSVARWTWDRYTGSGRCHRGAMQLDKSLPLEQRQRLSAKRSADLRRQATESKLRAACRDLQQKGKQLAIAAVARLAGVSRQTASKYLHIFDEVIAPQVVAVLKPKAVKPSNAKFGVHQVAAAPVEAAKESPSFGGLRGGLAPEPSS